MPGVPYLVHFPDGRTEVHEIRLPYVATPGTTMPPGWIVQRVEPIETMQQADGEDLTFEVWVAAAPDDVAGTNVEEQDSR